MTDSRELLLASLDKQFLLAKGRMRDIVSSLCGLQAQFANNPGHALRARAGDFHPRGWHGGLVKTWTFRRTLHAVREDELGLYLSAMGVPEKWTDAWGLSPKKMARWASFLHARIREGICEREALKDACRLEGMTAEELECAFHGWGGLLAEMCKRGLIAYASGTAKRFVACGEVAFVERDEARSRLLERYFRHLGPATFTDCAYFFGFTKKTVAGLLRARPLPLKSLSLGGEEYWYLGEWNAAQDIPLCLFLAGFDQLHMAYRDRSRLVDEKHRRDVVTNTGIVHPTVLLDGRVKAKWKRSGKALVVTPFAGLNRRLRRRVADFGMELFDGEVEEVEFADT